MVPTPEMLTQPGDSLKTTMPGERQNGLTKVSKEILLCWKTLLVQHIKHPSIRLRKGAEIN